MDFEFANFITAIWRLVCLGYRLLAGGFSGLDGGRRLLVLVLPGAVGLVIRGHRGRAGFVSAPGCVQGDPQGG
ncbi:MAG: hypothetical protein VX438_16990 [Planctomycetota bacterium]|nr:hypothetical protein [Planctomycetota bacterium]